MNDRRRPAPSASPGSPEAAHAGIYCAPVARLQKGNFRTINSPADRAIPAQLQERRQTMSKKGMTIALLAAGMLAAGGAQAATEIQWWHSMAGKLGDKVNEIAQKFNASQSEYKVVPVFKGQYDESMTAAIAAYRSGNPPGILQVFEVGTATMMAAKGAIKPVYQLMAEQHEKFDPKAFLPAVTSYYSDTKGNLLSMPFNSSTQVLYINKDEFKKAGLDPSKPPKTWPELEQDAAKLKQSGAACAYTTGWQSWVQLESFSAWHNVPFATKQNGFGGLGTRLEFNGPLEVRHIQNLG